MLRCRGRGVAVSRCCGVAVWQCGGVGVEVFDGAGVVRRTRRKLPIGGLSGFIRELVGISLQCANDLYGRETTELPSSITRRRSTVLYRERTTVLYRDATRDREASQTHHLLHPPWPSLMWAGRFILPTENCSSNIVTSLAVAKTAGRGALLYRTSSP